MVLSIKSITLLQLLRRCDLITASHRCSRLYKRYWVQRGLFFVRNKLLNLTKKFKKNLWNCFLTSLMEMPSDYYNTWTPMLTSGGFYLHQKNMNQRGSGNVLSVIGIESDLNGCSINLWIMNSDHVGATYACRPTLLLWNRAACFVFRLYSLKQKYIPMFW